MSRAAACDDVRRAVLNTCSESGRLQAVSGRSRTQDPGAGESPPACGGARVSWLGNMCGRKFIYTGILILNMHGSSCMSVPFDVRGGAGTPGSAGVFPPLPV